MPWYGVVEGEILAGESDVAVPNVRVCSRLKSSTTSSDTSVGTVSDAESPSLASYTYVVHSNSDRISDAYKVTDTQTGTSVELDNAEHLKIDLNIFSSVSSVSVCVASTTDLTTAPEFIVRVMDYDDPDDAGNTGNMCIEDEISSVADGNVCIKYSCVGTHISSFSGQYITVLSGESSTQSIAEVFVTGSEITCPYSGFSDDDGNFEIEITEENGATSKNAKVGVMAFKTVVFDRSDSTLFQTVANETDTSIPEPDAVLIALEYDATGLTASLGSTSALGYGLYLPCDSEVDEDGYFLVFRHDSSTGLYFSDSNSFAEVKHTGDSSADYKYSRLDEVETYGKSADGTYEFKLVYPAYDGWTNIWKQTSNPVTMTSRGVEGYEAISIGATSSYTFKGLEYNLGSSAFIDGIIDTGWWWYPIGSFQSFGNNKILFIKPRF